MLLFFLLCIETWFQILSGINLINSIFHRYKEFKASVNDFPFPFLGLEILSVEFNERNRIRHTHSNFFAVASIPNCHYVFSA